MADNSSKQRTRKDPIATDIAARLVQFQRRNAAETRPRPKADRPTPGPSKPLEVPREKQHPRDDFVREKPHPRDDFARNMPVLSTSPRLFNPNVDPIPIRRTQEPEAMSDDGSGSPPKHIVSRLQQRSEQPTSRRLYDPKRDPVPVRFAVPNRPNGTPAENVKPAPSHRSSGDYVSASSTSISSYPPSLGSSAFTLTSASSSSSSPAFNQGKEDPNSPVVSQLKRLYRHISQAERKLLEEKQDDLADEPSRVVVQSREHTVPESTDPWNRLINEHKELAELMHNFLTLTLSPQVPVSFHGYPTSYNIPSRLWTNAFHRILESLRRASLTSALALEHLSDLIFYAYSFYGGLLENPILVPYRGGWLEALGDLARYRMAVAAHVASAPFSSRAPERPQAMFSTESASDARIDDSPSPSVGPGAALALDIEPERETWRRTARDWYAKGLKDTPGLGRLHHHLAIVSREGEGEEMRAVYHFVKSMMTSNPFPTSRESILAMFTPGAQARRTQPDARTGDLFLLLHGMLFTHIQLDDFVASHARFMERLALEGAEEREWIMMAIVNLGAVLEYGRTDGAVKNAALAGAGGRMQNIADKRVTAVVSRTEELKLGDSTEDEKKMDVDDLDEKRRNNEGEAPRISTPSSIPDSPELSHTLNLSLQLTFTTLSHALHHPWRKSNAFARPSLNPYITVVLTFLSTLAKHSPVLALMERVVPWDDFADFFNTIPRAVVNTELEQGAKGLTHGCSALPEDWCLRGTEWMRRVYERGFWKTDSGGGEVDVLNASEDSADGATDGIIEEDEEEQGGAARQNETGRRWVRAFRAGVHLVRAVDGFDWDKTERKWKVEGTLRDKVERWKEIEKRERAEEEERRMRGGRWADDMDVDEDEIEAEMEEDSDDDEDSEQVKELKARRRHFRSLLQAAQRGGSHAPRRPRHKGASATRAPLHVVAGYSVLVVDTNILISSLNMFSSLVESLRWTIVIPLAVVTELDGLSSNDSQLGTAASTALTYLTTHLRTHATSLKVQTSRGNYLTTLSVRGEQVNLNDSLSWERNMDDLILRAAIWQDEHWVDRSALLKSSSADAEAPSGAAKVVLLSFDRNLRLKARARQLDAADEKDMAAILAAGT